MDLGVIEKKVLGALLILSDSKGVTHAKLSDIADTMNYKSGGAITFALKILERENFIIKTNPQEYRVLI